MLASTQSSNHRLLIDILLTHGGMTIRHLAEALSISADTLNDMYSEQRGFAEDTANRLAQLCALFLGRRLKRH